jgi:hypothetical protein
MIFGILEYKCLSKKSLQTNSERNMIFGNLEYKHPSKQSFQNSHEQ